MTEEERMRLLKIGPWYDHDIDTVMNLDIEKGVTCLICQKQHDPKAESFLSIKGDIWIGFVGGMIGGNLGPGQKVLRYSYVCRAKKCLDMLSKYLIGDYEPEENIKYRIKDQVI